MAAMTTVLHLMVTDNWGGTEVQVAELVKRSAATEACSHVVAFLAPHGGLGTDLAQRGHEVHLLGGRGGAVGSLCRLVALLRARRPDILEAYGFRAAMTARAAIALSGTRPRLVIGVRGLHIIEGEDPDHLRTRAVLAVERMHTRVTAGYDANSEGACKFLIAKGFPPRKFTVIPNGVEPLRLDPPSETAARIDPSRPLQLLCVARFVPRKQHHVLLRALASLRDVDLVCSFVGEGPERTEMERLALSLALDGAVRFCGVRPRAEVVEMLRHTDIFVLCSLWEGLPGSVLEAMSAGVPVIGTDVNGTRELIDHRKTGLLVPSGDERALADAIRELSTDHALRARLARAGWHQARDQYSFDQLVERKNAYFTAIARGTR
jgi:glycosyltransferase involved in cell wall biosynthesis